MASASPSGALPLDPKEGVGAPAAALTSNGIEDVAAVLPEGMSMSQMFAKLSPARRREIEQRAEQRLREHNLEAFLAFGDGDAAAAKVRPKTPAMKEKDAVWVVPNVLTADECMSVRRAVDEAAAARGGWQSRHRRFPTMDLPLSAALSLEPMLREVIFQRIIRALATFYCGEAFLPEHLEVRECFFVKYSAEAGGQRALPMHTDGSLFSFNILLNDPLTDFDGGGTTFASTDWTVRVPMGAAVVHGGDSFHAGYPIVRGERYLLVGFVQETREQAYVVAESVAAASAAFLKFGHAAWERSTGPAPIRLTSASAEVHHLPYEPAETHEAPAMPDLSAGEIDASRDDVVQVDVKGEVVVEEEVVAVEGDEERRNKSATRIQAAHRGKVGRELASDEAMLAEAEEAMSRAEAQRSQDALQDAHCSAARLSLFAACSTFEDAARLLLTSSFRQSTSTWEQANEQSVVVLSESQHRLASRRPLQSNLVFSTQNLFEFRDHLARPQSRGQSTGDEPPPQQQQLTNCPTTRVHRFRLRHELRSTLLPELRAAALKQRKSDRDGVQVSNVGGWHSPEQAFELSGEYDLWYSNLLPVLLATLSHLTAAESSSGVPPLASLLDADRTITGWLNSSEPTSFNMLHDHGRDVEWSLVLFVATGEDATSARDSDDLGGSLLLKTQMDADVHGFFPIAPIPGELWVFPGYTPHCVLPRTLQANGAPPRVGDDDVEDDSRQRVSVAFNVYARRDGGASTFVEENLESVLQARDRAAQAMKALALHDAK